MKHLSSVVAAPEPMPALCSDWQLNHMVRYLTLPSVIGVDPILNFGDFIVTSIAFLLDYHSEGHSSVLLGPLLLYQQKRFCSYHFFTSTLVSL